MTDREVRELLARGTTSKAEFDPSVKTEITRQSLDAMVREVKSHLARKRKVSVIIVKE